MCVQFFSPIYVNTKIWWEELSNGKNRSLIKPFNLLKKMVKREALINHLKTLVCFSYSGKMYLSFISKVSKLKKFSTTVCVDTVVLGKFSGHISVAYIPW